MHTAACIVLVVGLVLVPGCGTRPARTISVEGDAVIADTEKLDEAIELLADQFFETIDESSVYRKYQLYPEALKGCDNEFSKYVIDRLDYMLMSKFTRDQNRWGRYIPPSVDYTGEPIGDLSSTGATHFIKLTIQLLGDNFEFRLIGEDDRGNRIGVFGNRKLKATKSWIEAFNTRSRGSFERPFKSSSESARYLAERVCKAYDGMKMTYESEYGDAVEAEYSIIFRPQLDQYINESWERDWGADFKYHAKCLKKVISREDQDLIDREAEGWFLGTPDEKIVGISTDKPIVFMIVKYSPNVRGGRDLTKIDVTAYILKREENTFRLSGSVNRLHCLALFKN